MIPDLTPGEVARFYSKIRVAGCGMRWAGGDLNNHGYGRFTIYRGGKRIRILAHRLAYKLATGEDPGAAVIRHGCDTPLCCTPDCLVTGTQAQNIRDAVTRGRLNTSGLSFPHAARRAAAQQRIAAGRKRCSGCKHIKPFAQFSLHIANLDGHQGECKDCLGGRRRARREAV